MNGSVQKKKTNNLYYPVVYLGIDELTHKKKQKWGHGHKLKRDAEKELRQMINDFEDGYIPVKRGQIYTLNEIFSEWSEIIKTEGVYDTGKSYDMAMSNVKNHVLAAIGDADISSITHVHLRKLFSEMKNKGTGAPLNNATKKKIKGTLMHIFDFALEMKLIRSNPCRDLKIGEPKTPDKIIWNAKEIDYFLSWCRDNLDYEYYLAYLILATTAMRRGEVCALRWQDLQGEYLTISHSMTVDKTVKDTKTGATGSRTIVLFNSVLDALEVQRRRQSKLIKTLLNVSEIQDRVKPWDFILTDDYNRPVNPQYLSRTFKTSVEKINKEHGILPIMPLKNLRHSYATLGLVNGVNIPDMQRQLGHTKPSTTQNSYNQFLETMQKTNRDKMENLLFG